MKNVGFSTGPLYKSQIPFDEGIKLYLSFGVDAIELSFPTPDKLLEYHLSEQVRENIKKFKSVSIHAPWKGIRYNDNPDTRKIIEELSELCSKLPIRGLVLHPDTIDNFELLDKSALPFLLENMDKRKSYGTHPNQFRELKKKFSFGFVLDVQHAYEHDPSMQLAREFVDVMGDRLSHMHVSGCSESQLHVPTYCAINREAITQILKMNLQVPKILEGILSENIQDSIACELNYIQDYI